VRPAAVVSGESAKSSGDDDINTGKALPLQLFENYDCSYGDDRI
jgi:hypothetical protein